MSDWSVVWWPVQSRDDLLVLIPTNTDHPTVQPTVQPTGQCHHPTIAPLTSAPSPVSLSVSAIRNEGLACIAMAASIPALQTLTGACKLYVLCRWRCVSCLWKARVWAWESYVCSFAWHARHAPYHIWSDAIWYVVSYSLLYDALLCYAIPCLAFLFITCLESYWIMLLWLDWFSFWFIFISFCSVLLSYVLSRSV